MIIIGIGGVGKSRFIRTTFSGFGANRYNYYYGYGKHLDPCFKEYTQFIKRKVQE